TPTVDTSGAGVLIDQALTHSQAMANLQHLTDVIGPRLTGSPAARAANDWTLAKFKEYGLDARLEQWNFGGTWTRGPMWMRLVAPRMHDVVAASWAWAPGTNGKTVSGPVVRIDASTAESIEANRARVKGAVAQWNSVAELRGSERPGQVVIVGAHLDSWDLGTGATDNGTGSIATLEAARIIAQSGLKPKRTVRFILFTGEEQGLIGSRKYAEAHAADADTVQAVIVLDNGAGAITGMALQGHLEAYALWRTL